MSGPSLGPASETEQVFSALDTELKSASPSAPKPVSQGGPTFNAAEAKANWNALQQAKTEVAAISSAPATSTASATPSADPVPATSANAAPKPVAGVPEGASSAARTAGAGTRLLGVLEHAGAAFAGFGIGFHLGQQRYGQAALDTGVLGIWFINPVAGFVVTATLMIPDAANASVQREKWARDRGLPPPLERGKI
jgi:hypothetical protein